MEMKAPLCSAVLEPLDKYNYADWNIQVKTYLRAQSLWDIVEPIREPPKQGEDKVAFQVWDKKDSMALHVIQMSCGKEAFSRIREISSAKNAWNILKTEFGPSTVISENDGDGDSDINQCTNAIYTKNFGNAWQLLDQSLVDARDSEGNTPLMALASVPDAFPSGNPIVFWKGWIYKYCISVDRDPQTHSLVAKVRAPLCHLGSDILRYLGIKHLCDMKLMHGELVDLLRHLFFQISDSENSVCVGIATIRAVKNGIFEFVDKVSWSIQPDSFLAIADEKSRNVLFLAVLHRQHEIFKRIARDDGLKRVLTCQKDDDGNTLLHMAGISPDFTKLNQIPGAALQMQRELQWFKEVQKIVPAEIKEATNKDGLTAHEFFTKNHVSMLKEGEQWTKDTASACSVVGTLIVGIIFAAAITVPGGNMDNTGLPFFSKDKLFILFMVSDAISLFSSSTSLLMFLVISTSRYAEEDFQESLPTKMMIALSTLLFSIVTMMIAFAAALLIVLHSQLWIIILIVCLACVPIVAFIQILFLFLVEVTLSTYGQNMFSKEGQWSFEGIVQRGQRFR